MFMFNAEAEESDDEIDVTANVSSSAELVRLSSGGGSDKENID